MYHLMYSSYQSYQYLYAAL